MSGHLAEDRSFESIVVGESASLETRILERDVETFAQLSGDYNPLHTDVSYAALTPFKERVVHGMLLGSFVSRLVGMQLPGRRALLVRETLEFIMPVHIGNTINVTGTVVAKSESTGLIELKIVITSGGTVASTGTVHVRVRA